jgi:hypothetical protein
LKILDGQQLLILTNTGPVTTELRLANMAASTPSKSSEPKTLHWHP